MLFFDNQCVTAKVIIVCQMAVISAVLPDLTNDLNQFCCNLFKSSLATQYFTNGV